MVKGLLGHCGTATQRGYRGFLAGSPTRDRLRVGGSLFQDHVCGRISSMITAQNTCSRAIDGGHMITMHDQATVIVDHGACGCDARKSRRGGR